MILIETGYACRKQLGILCVIPEQKLREVIETIQKTDPLAFVTVTQTMEVRAQGFPRAREPLLKNAQVG